MAEPALLTAGDTWAWTRSEPSYPASAGWVLMYYLSAGATAPKTITATASGDEHAASVTAITSKDWATGVYHWTARVSKGSEVYTVGTGTFQVLPDPSGTYDRRTRAERMVAAISTALEASAGDLSVEYEVDGLRIKKDRAAALRELGAWQAAVRSERGGSVLRCIPVRFGGV